MGLNRKGWEVDWGNALRMAIIILVILIVIGFIFRGTEGLFAAFPRWGG